MVQQEKSRQKERQGQVVSTKMHKTVTVKVARTFAHPQFNKIITRSKKYYAHCEGFDVKEGQMVRIIETRPYSKMKRWRVVEVVA
ncbi:30S ribosomal protein S17 [Rhabdochlamydiaceae symbiont of Dictyostelium giganteum]|uniref:30S ribosomal protein S17 n=1 Tax=Rhabdochlamydiaceae symbiont of Dictyostelium giganteum TaxID=3342349 RepID=UPI00384E6402